MKKTAWFVVSFLVVLSVITFLKIELFPFGFHRQGTNPNESFNIYKSDQKFKTTNDFIKFIDDELYIHEFRDDNRKLNVEKLNKYIQEKRLLWKKYFEIDIGKQGECLFERLKVTEDGHVFRHVICGV